jgi:hypothetical protein
MVRAMDEHSLQASQISAEGEGFDPLEGMFRNLVALRARGGME